MGRWILSGRGWWGPLGLGLTLFGLWVGFGLLGKNWEKAFFYGHKFIGQ
jgi:hypothetical protein